MQADTILPIGNIKAPDDVGKIVRARRKKLGLTQIELASLSGVGNRFVVDLEAGKPTLQIGKLLRVFRWLGIDLIAKVKS